MYLTKDQEKMLSGEYGWAAAKALELIVRVGGAMGAEELVEVKHAHVSGVSYTNVGDHGLEFLSDFYAKGGRARVYTTINPGCVDYSGLSNIIDNDFAARQMLVDNILQSMGFKPVHTCIPHYHRPPLENEHLAWGESSAVIYANSVFGARTNREGGPVALSASITGYTYKAGLHIESNRVARVKVEVPAISRGVPPGALGLWIGDHIREIPYITGVKNLDVSGVKSLLASMAASGNHALAVLNGITPRNTYRVEIEDKVVVEDKALEEYLGDDISSGDRVLGYVGCPHLHPVELLKVVELLRKYGPPRKGKLMITVPREYAITFQSILYELRVRGVDVAVGTCPIVSRLKEKFDVVLTNSGKALFYMKKIHGVKARIVGVEEVVKCVCRGFKS